MERVGQVGQAKLLDHLPYGAPLLGTNETNNIGNSLARRTGRGAARVQHFGFLATQNSASFHNPSPLRNDQMKQSQKIPLSMRYVLAMLVCLTSAAGAAEVGPCNGLDRISYLVGQTKSYSAGKITIANVDTNGEPVCCSAHLIILIPSPEIGSQCFAVSKKAAQSDSDGQTGFNSVEFDQIKSSYDPNRGLLLSVPYTLYNPDGGKGRPGSTNVRIDLRNNGSVKIEP